MTGYFYLTWTSEGYKLLIQTDLRKNTRNPHVPQDFVSTGQCKSKEGWDGGWNCCSYPWSFQVTYDDLGRLAYLESRWRLWCSNSIPLVVSESPKAPGEGKKHQETPRWKAKAVPSHTGPPSSFLSGLGRVVPTLLRSVASGSCQPAGKMKRAVSVQATATNNGDIQSQLQCQGNRC